MLISQFWRCRENAVGQGAEEKKKKEVDEIEALWSKALKDMVKSKVGLADDYIDILVRE